MSVSEVACTYAALILWDDGIPVTGEKISTLVKAANVPIEAYWPGLFARLLEKRNIEDLLLSVGSGGGGAAAPIAAAPGGGGGAAAAEAAPAVEEKKEEPKEESDEDMGFSLFD